MNQPEFPRPYELNVILVRTLYDSNIGATSRAMDNMGANKLFLIGKQCTITYAAQQAAASGQNAFLNRIEYDTWDDFFANETEGIRIAFSARDGRGRPLWEVNQIFDWLKNNEPRLQKKSDVVLPIYLIFGPEDVGLSNKDLELVHYNANIPTYGENPSLNLAQAVLIALYSIRRIWGGQKFDFFASENQKSNRHVKPSREVFPEMALQTWLKEMGFDLSKKKINVYTILKRMILHNVPTPKELRILEIVLQQSIRKLREYNQFIKITEKPNSIKNSDQPPTVIN